MLKAAVLIFAGAVALMPQGDGIIRLKPRDFRQLPATVRRDLDRRGCTIPQYPRKPAAHNVLSGSFISRGSRDWAVLCSVKGSSRILVYRNGGVSRVDSMARARDSVYLQDGGDGVMEFSRKIDLATPKNITDFANASGAKPPRLDHNGIEDGFIGTGSSMRYYSRGKWVQLSGGN